IKTLLSNDMGVAFYVTIEGLHFFHSGDLNWWRWPQESKEWNDGMEKIYKEEMKRLKDLPLDFAFIPADPRLGDNYLLSVRYFIDKIRPDECLIFPMHFGDDWKVFDSLKNDGYLDDEIVIPITHRGQKFEVYK
ncbi:MAG: MBL fold metallo-hydrolase, partial [Vallitaleaceae bacterium]|nr:MBL fold metallo-hydrolase [Vallitaleaceae bacterium]